MHSGEGGEGQSQLAGEGEACWASTVSWPRVPRWCSSSVAGCLGHRIQTPGLWPWRAAGSESNMASARAGRVV